MWWFLIFCAVVVNIFLKTIIIIIINIINIFLIPLISY